MLQTATAGGPSGRELFDPVAHCDRNRLPARSRASPAACRQWRPQARNQLWTQVACWSRAFSALGFLVLEAQRIRRHGRRRRRPQRSAFLSSFFALVGCHGLHVSAGLLWLGTMMAQVFVKGFRADILRRLICFNLFWHALDIIWVALFTIVYLIGGGR